MLHIAIRRDFASAEATRGLSDRPLDPFGAATFGVIYGFVFCCKGRNVSYAFVIYNKYYTKSMRIWQAINRFAKRRTFCVI